MQRIATAILVLLCMSSTFAQERVDPLPSWQDGTIKEKIIQFVEQVSDKKNPHFVPVENRIATLDNDGTLWVEKPLYTQFIFALDRIKTLAPKHPEWKQQPPFKFVLTQQLNKLNLSDFEKILGVTHTGMTVTEFQKIATHWLANSRDKRFHRYYTELVYQPMIEVINYLHQHQFKVYVVSGGGQDFMRAFVPTVYHIPTEHIIGTTGKLNYVYYNQQPELIKLPSVLMIDDGKGKPADIHLFIGKKPILAFGNSDGDKEMLEWTQSNTQFPHLMLLVHHDDAKREYAYDTHSMVGRFSEALMQEAEQNHWEVISMKNDWKQIFAFASVNTHS